MKTATRPVIPTIADRLKDVTQYSELKRLADNIILAQRQKQFRSLAVLSLFPGEGKTLFTAMMALAYVEAFSLRALVVDTSTFRHPRSLQLRQCFDTSSPLIDVLSLDEYRRTPNGNGAPPPRPQDSAIKGDAPSMPVHVAVKRESDQFLIRRLSEERTSQYGLILLDTAPLTSKNKGNIDPLLMARLTDASVLVTNPHLFDATSLDGQLEALKDPAVHLIGIVSNEVYPS